MTFWLRYLAFSVCLLGVLACAKSASPSAKVPPPSDPKPLSPQAAWSHSTQTYHGAGTIH